MVEAGLRELERPRAAANRRGRFDDVDREPFAREERRRGESVRASADDNRVIGEAIAGNTRAARHAADVTSCGKSRAWVSISPW